jgi:hypothetical protein
MKLCVKHKKGIVEKYQMDILKEFILQLQKNLPLKGKVTIHFLEKQEGKMTTGSFKDKQKLIKVLFKGRMLADILRTLSHEWAHCYDHQEKHIKDRNPIGGEAEDFANEKSGEETKRYIKSNPRLKSKIFKPV